MGTYFNPNNMGFKMARNDLIYVDKSLLIDKMNALINTRSRFICFSRPRRFGKSTDAKMLSAYYSKGCDSHFLFDDLMISQNNNYQIHLNKYNVIYIDMQYFYNLSTSINDMIELINEELIMDINKDYHISLRRNKLSLLLNAIYSKTDEQFIFIIDEWDCVLRDTKSTKEDKDNFLVLMNELLKEKEYVALAYMTGILPIKKYGDESAINMFDEISMLDPMTYENYMGFTENEVKDLCYQYSMNFDEIKDWYDGYHFNNGVSIYSPRSIVKAMTTKNLGNYWSKTASFENIKKYISLNYDGLKDAIHRLLIGDKILVDTSTFSNDMASVQSKDDVLTLLIHLGYLAYDSVLKSVYIPNKEVIDSFISVVKETRWPETMRLIQRSDRLLEATWNQDEETVSEIMEEVHDSYVTSPLKYNNEDALTTTILMGYFTAQDYYTIIRELPSGKGYCDIGFIPIDSTNPAMIVELKWNKKVDEAIKQINDRNYLSAFEHYQNNLLMVGISYESDSRRKSYKQHTCKITKYKDEP